MRTRSDFHECIAHCAIIYNKPGKFANYMNFKKNRLPDKAILQLRTQGRCALVRQLE